MSGYSTIEWTDATWNPVTGCTKVSEGCAHCYAERLAERFRGIKSHPYEQGFDLRLWPERLAQPLRGAFGAKVSRIQELIGTDPAFLFVDPKGWKGAAMTYIAPLARRPGRDVMINVMFDHINRFKDAPLVFIQTQMQEFFGQPLAPRLSEEALMQSYREQLKSTCGLQFAADLIVPHPTRERTKFRSSLSASR